MSGNLLRIGIVGAGDNTRKRHIPGLREIAGVELAAVCNRRASSTAQVARDFAIPRTFARWQDLVADPEIDAIVIGAWPYLHCPVTLAALAAGKHVLCEARMCMNVGEAMAMLSASKKAPNFVAQLVPSPYGLKADATIRRLLAEGYLGELREMQIFGLNGALANPTAPLSWRQDARLSGVNMLTVGILHETVLRWVPAPMRVLAQANAFIPQRADPDCGLLRTVGTPDSVQILTTLADGGRGVYHFSGVIPVGGQMTITLYGSEGMLRYDLSAECLIGANKRNQQVHEIEIPSHETGGWRVEADFVDSIRAGTPVRLTDFATGVRYMEFTEAVARSAELGRAVDLAS
jgi:predicted dehydrogenase